MSELVKATLTEITAANPPATVGDAVPVQFNPASLRMQLSNRSAGGAQAGAQARQRAGEGEVSVNFDLVFDTADEGTPAAPLSVLSKTAAVERFVRPRGNRPGQEAPPRVQFKWGAIRVQGVMESLSLDLDLFAADGTPLRARCSVAIKGQDAAYQYAPQGAGAGSNAPAAGGANNPTAAAAGAGAPTPPGGKPASAIDSITRALQGESLAQLAARVGLDAGGWRALAGGIGDPLQLKAGQEIGLPATAGSGASSGGAAAGALASTQKSLTAAPASANGSAAPPSAAATGAAAVAALDAGALTRAGGVAGAAGEARATTHEARAAQTLAGFGLPAPAARGAVSPLRATAPADDRPYGFGLPLKPRRAVAAADSAEPTRSRRPRATLRSTCRCGGRCACGA